MKSSLDFKIFYSVLCICSYLKIDEMNRIWKPMMIAISFADKTF